VGKVRKRLVTVGLAVGVPPLLVLLALGGWRLYVSILILRLLSGDVATQRSAAWHLGRTGDLRAVQPLIYASGDPERSVRSAALMALGHIGGPRAILHLRATLREGDGFAKAWACKSLDMVAVPPAMVPGLIAELARGDTRTRREAAWLLSKTRDEEALEALLATANDKDMEVRQHVFRGLTQYADRRVLEALLATSRDKDPKVQVLAAEALIGYTHPYTVRWLTWDWQVGKQALPPDEFRALLHKRQPQIVEALVRSRTRGDAFRRGGVAEALGRFKDPHAVSALVAALKDRHKFVREQAALALKEVKDRKAVPPLIAALEDEDLYVRTFSAWAPGEIKDRRAVEPLVGLLSDDVAHVRKRATWSLEKITGESFGRTPQECRQWWKRNLEAGRTVPSHSAQ